LKRLFVIGHPIGHSLSPVMHGALIAHWHLDASYGPLDLDPARFEARLAELAGDPDFLGANVTIPFKQDAARFLGGRLEPMARLTGSVNTLFWKNGELWGDSTDGYGALENLREHGIDLASASVAVIGNGGASKAIVHALRQAPVRSLAVFARTVREEGESPLESFAGRSGEFSLLVNTTPIGMHPHEGQSPVPREALHADLAVFDIVYNPRETQLLRDAREAGCQVVPGLGMLVHQGALSFARWFPQVGSQAQNAQVMRGALG
jgi:shikimate dehydrogenase